MAPAEPCLRDKLAHFDLMKRLAEDSEGSDDGDGVAAGERLDRQHRMRFFSKDAKTTTPVIRATQPFHVRPRPGAYEGPDGAGDETVVPETRRVDKTRQRQLATPLPLPKHVDRNDASMPMDGSPSLGANKGKKRKRESVHLRPEGEHVFKALRFYYVPNDDVAPVRRLRISKAREFGALWTREPLTATHVIVDKGISYRDVQKVLGEAGAETKIVVNEEYPLDCIRFRSLLDHGQNKYRVPGQPPETDRTKPAAEVTTAAAERPRTRRSNESTASSLKVKAQNRSSRRRDHVHVPGLGTPLRSNDAENAAAGQSRGEHGNDELSQYITMMQEFKDLPLDNDEDDDEERSGSDPEQRQTSKGVRRKDTRFSEQGFACHQAGAQDAEANNPNARTIEVLQRMANYYERVNDQWRSIGYRKAMATLRRQTVRVTSEEEAAKLPHIGRRIARKIEEIATTNELRRLAYAEREPTDSALQLFLQIYGVGTGQAQQWLARGYRTLDDLRTKARLSPGQRIGVEHLEDLNRRIPRREVEALGEHVRRVAARVDPLLELIIGGSYRRGSPSSRDIDLIVTKPDTRSVEQLQAPFAELLRTLEDEGFLTARLASFHPGSKSGSEGGSRFHGCCVLPPARDGAGTGTGTGTGHDGPIWRRIDFLLVPETQMGGALIYFTGNDMFNRSMRLLARRKGMRLNQRGLFYRRGAGGTTTGAGTTGELVEGRSERRIFELLGVQWREPSERWC
ncbi:hypothetical protein E4U41_004332 [Claviceps citrina]|nr:hypothetical protein E4U41_004332 [Claviceps citrina]